MHSLSLSLLQSCFTAAMMARTNAALAPNPTVPHAPISLTAFFIATPHKTSSRRADILDSHPPIQDRIEALVKYAGGRMPKPAALPSEPAPDAELPQASPSA